jgi:hypothetical protein
MTGRDAVLREELVDLADRQRPARVNSPRTLIASIAAFAIAGAITGGTVAAVASSRDDQDGLELHLASARIVGLQLVGQHTPLVGDPVEQLRSGSGELDLGPRPDGANAIAFALHCVSVGDFSFSAHSVLGATLQCPDESDTEPGHGMTGLFIDPAPDGDNLIEFTVEDGARYTVWAAWVTRPAPVEASAAQAAALADGIVDEAEYRAGLDRYIACMAEAGFTVDVLDTAEPIARYVIGNDAVLDGADERCYAAEFREIDIEWQISVKN